MTSTTAAELLARSHRLGSDPRNTNFAGGNTSGKGRVLDPVNIEAQLSGGLIFGLGHAMNCELTYSGGVPAAVYGRWARRSTS